MYKPLSSIKVLELADYVSAPVCCRLLADMGAEVIKVERNTGNVWRVTGQSYVPNRFSLDENPVYDIYNTGKKHIVINLKTEEGLSILKRLLTDSDVFVTNNRPAALERLGLSYEKLRDEFPKLIYAIGLGYGEKGPDADSPAYDTSAFWSRTGFLRDMAVAGENYSPVCPPSSMGDTFTGMTLATEVCAAIINRQKTGHGECVKSSLFHNAIFAMGTMQIWTQRPFGTEFPKTRIQHGMPNGYYKCKDQEYIFIAAGYAPQLIPSVFRMIGKPELIDDNRFNSIAERRKHSEEFYQILTDAFLQKDVGEWLKLGKDYDIPMSKMQHFADVSEDEQSLVNGYVEPVKYKNGHVDMIASSPIEMESLGQLKTLPSHGIGEDTEQVLIKYGYKSEEIELLREKGIIN